MAQISMPESFFSSVKFELHRYMSANMLKGGRTQVMEQAEPRWMATFTTGRLNESRRRIWSGFWASLRGGLNELLAFDPSQDYPYNYPNFDSVVRSGGGSFTTGIAGVTAISANSVSVGGGGAGLLPANFALIPGDRFALVEGNNLGLYVLTEYHTANSGGQVILANFEPKILTNIFTTAAQAHFWRPRCVMIPDPNSWDMTITPDSPPATFSAIQKLF